MNIAKILGAATMIMLLASSQCYSDDDDMGSFLGGSKAPKEEKDEDKGNVWGNGKEEKKEEEKGNVWGKKEEDKGNVWGSGKEEKKEDKGNVWGGGGKDE